MGANNIAMIGALGAVGARVSNGYFSSMEVANPISGSVTGNAGTVTAAAQPSITSVGTLTGLSVTNPIAGSVTGSAGSAATAGTVTAADQPSITSVGTLTGLTVTSIINGSVNGSAVNIDGGAIGEILVQTGGGLTGKLAAGNSGLVLMANGSGAAPSWSSTPAIQATNISGDITAVSNISIGGALNVGTYSTLNSSVTAKSDLGVTGYTTVTSMTVTGPSTFTASMYVAGVSSFSAESNIYIQGGNPGEVLSKKDATGRLQWTAVSDLGDNLGNHVATTTLNMNNFGIVNAASATFVNGVTASSFTAISSVSVGGSLSVGTYATFVGGIGVAGYTAVSSMTVTGTSTFTATSYFGSSITVAGEAVIGSSLNVSGYGVFFSTVQIANGNLKYGADGVGAGKVLKSDTNGFVSWGTDLTGAAASFLGTSFYLQMQNSAGDGLVNSLLMQNNATDTDGTNITMLSGSSFTINGPFESTGTVKLGNASAGLGDVNINGITTFVSSVTFQGNTQLGNSNTDIHAVNSAADVNVALKVTGDPTAGGDKHAAQFWSGSQLVMGIRKK